MQRRSYAAVPNSYATMVPVRFMAPPNYQQRSPVRSPQRAPQPMRYQPAYQARNLPPPPMHTMMPFVPPPQQYPQQYLQQYPQQYFQQYPQQYYYDTTATNVVNRTDMDNSKPSKTARKKDDGMTVGPDGVQSKGIQALVGNKDVNELLKQKGTKVKVSKIYRITKKKPRFQDDDTSDDEYEQVPIEDSPRPRTFKQSSVPTKRSAAQNERFPSVASSCSHCSTCSNCSCSDCRIRNGGHMYDDCPECRAEAELYLSRRTQRKHK